MACSSQVPNVSGSAIKVKPGVDIWNPNVSVEQLFEGEVKGRLLLDKLFELYQVGEGRKTLRFFKDGTENNHNIPFSEKPKNLARHMEYNPRHQAGVKMQYVKSVKARGIVESVRGECWAIAPAENDGRPAPYLLLSCASLVEAYYTAIAEEPNNENLIATAKKGMEARVLSIRTPASVCRYLTTLRNQFHHGASTNFLELIRIAPQVDTALAVWKHNQGLTWKVENYESKCANYVKTHPEFGEVFPDWRLFEGARGCHQVLVTKRGQSFFDNMWDEFGQTVDFMHGRLANTVVLQCMQHVATSIIQTIYDGMSESDVNLLLMECLQLCVPQLGDDDDRAWVFDSVPKKQLVHRLFTAMNGSVTAVGGKTDGATNTRKRKASGNAPKAKAKARRTPAGSAAQGAGANEPDVNIPSDPRLNVTTIDCQYGVRNKLWLDDLMQCASHTVSSLQSQFGNFLDAETLDKTKVGIIRLGLRFAFCGDVTVTTKKGTKKYSKWSLLRPALQAHGVYLVTQVLKQHMAEIIQTGASDSHQDHAQLQELTSDPAVMFSDKTVSMNDKLIRFAAALDGWFRNEPTKILSTPQPLRVSDHASFGQLKATQLTSCTCSATTGAATSQAQSACMFHCSDPDLKDVLYQVCRCVHSTFSDSWACFVNIFLESCISGWAAPTGLEQYQLEAKHARPLSSMRATYMIQLLVDLCAKTAKSTTWANLFARLDERETQSSLVTLDSCSIGTMVFRYPRKLGRQGGAKYVKQWSFIFGHFVPKCYYFALIFTLRNFVLGILPAIFISHKSLLILSLAFTMCSYGFIQVTLWPWKTFSANVIDAGFALLTVMVMILATTLLEFDVEQELLLIQILSMLLAALVFFGAVAALVISVYKTYKPSRTYGIFLSHHKLGAGALARWFKMMMAEIIKNRIFLDSDDVNKLDAIMDVTAHDAENVVVLITSETLHRMWCAAEIACAWHAGTNIVLVSCDGNRVDEELIAVIECLWNEEQEATLLGAGVTIEMIESSYCALRDHEHIELDRRGAAERLHQRVVQQVIENSRGLTRRQFASRLTISGRRRSADGLAPFMMLSDLRTPEVGSCARVIMYLLRNRLQEDICLYDPYDVANDLHNFRQEMAVAVAILVLLTQGMLQDVCFAGTMAACPFMCRDFLVPIRADEFFVYPDPGFWENLAEGKVFEGQTLAEMETDFDGVRAAYAKLFNVLALKFSQHGSEHIQNTEIAMIGARLQPMLSGTGPGAVERYSSSASSRRSSRRSHPARERVGSKSSSSLPPPDMDLPAEREPLEPLETSGQMVHEEF